MTIPRPVPTTKPAENTIIFPTKEPPVNGYTAGLYVDLARLMLEGLPKPPAPTIGIRTDSVGLMYEGMVNSVFGDPESGKTMVCLCIATEQLFTGGRVLMLDLDHNGPESITSRMLSFGVSESVLADPQRFRYAEPEDAGAIAKIIGDAQQWRPTFVVIDSVGELLPLYGANSNSADDFTNVHSSAIKPFAKAGAAVVLIDHLAKGSDSRSFGSSGTAAKKRAISGVSLRVTVVEAFTPGTGGRADISIAKDRHGGLRAHSPVGDREPLAAKFSLIDREGALDWKFYAPETGDHAATDDSAPRVDVDALASLQPAPTSVTDVKERMGWGTDRSAKALRTWRESGAETSALAS